MTRHPKGWVLENPGDLDRTGRCRDCGEIYTRPHADGCSFGPGKVGELRWRPPTALELRAGLVREED